MSAIFLPRRWRHQPSGPVDVDTRHPLGAKVHYAYTPWLGLTSITPGQRRVTATPTGAALGSTVGRDGRAAHILRTGSFSGVGVNFDDTVSLATASAGGSFYLLVNGLTYGDDGEVGLIRISSSDGLRISSSPSRVLQFHAFSGTRLVGAEHVVEGYTGGIGVSAENRDLVSAYIGSKIGVDRQSTGGFSLRAVTGIRSVTVAYPTYGCPLFIRADYLTHDEMRELNDAPWTIFRAPSHRIWFDVGAGAPAAIEGDVVAEESGADTLTATGSVVIAGSLAAAETGADTFAATGGAVATGTLAATEAGADTLAGTGAVLVAGSLAVTEVGTDTAAATGAVLVAGALSATETGQDTFSASGAGLVTGTLAAVETETDAASATGKVVISGALDASEVGADTAQATGAVRVSGGLSASESGTDTFSSTGEQPRITGDLAASEIGADGFVAVGIVPAIGSFDVLESGHDSLSGAGQIIVAGVLGATETGADSFYATPAGSISGLMAAVEAADSFSARGHGRANRGARTSIDRGYQSMTMSRPAQTVTMRRPRQRG